MRCGHPHWRGAGAQRSQPVREVGAPVGGPGIQRVARDEFEGTCISSVYERTMAGLRAAPCNVLRRRVRVDIPSAETRSTAPAAVEKFGKPGIMTPNTRTDRLVFRLQSSSRELCAL